MKDYYGLRANRKYLSFSQVKALMQCGAAARYQIEHPPEPTEAMLQGSYVDAALTGDLAAFVADHPELVSSTGKTKGELKAAFKHCDAIVTRCRKDRLFMRMLTGAKQVQLIGDIDGYKFKARLDVVQRDTTVRKTAALFPELSELAFADGAIVDLKTTADFDTKYSADAGRRQSFLERGRYDLQGAIYQELYYQHTGKRLPFFLAVVTKQPEPDIAIFSFEQRTLDNALAWMRAQLPELVKRKTGESLHRCEVCEYCRRTKTLTAAKPAEALLYD